MTSHREVLRRMEVLGVLLISTGAFQAMGQAPGQVSGFSSDLDAPSQFGPASPFAQQPEYQQSAPSYQQSPQLAPQELYQNAPDQAAQEQEQVFLPYQLDNLVAPIALYPDQLLGQVLAASTYPSEIAQAAQWLQQNRYLQGTQLMDSARRQNWDPSVQALVAFPDALNLLTRDASWTTALGNAFLVQQADVITAIQRMRARAQSNGRLATTPQQIVSTQYQDGQSAIQIQPADPQTMYVPSYNPQYVWGPPAYGGDYPQLGYGNILGTIFGAAVNIGSLFLGFGSLFGWGGWGWLLSWFGHGLFLNGLFFNHFGFHGGGYGGGFYGGGARTAWVHDPGHRWGVPYANRAVASRFGGSYRAATGAFAPHGGSGFGSHGGFSSGGFSSGGFAGAGHGGNGGSGWRGAGGQGTSGTVNGGGWHSAPGGGQFGNSFAGSRSGSGFGSNYGGSNYGGSRYGSNESGNRGYSASGLGSFGGSSGFGSGYRGGSTFGSSSGFGSNSGFGSGSGYRGSSNGLAASSGYGSRAYGSGSSGYGASNFGSGYRGGSGWSSGGQSFSAPGGNRSYAGNGFSGNFNQRSSSQGFGQGFGGQNFGKQNFAAQNRGSEHFSAPRSSAHFSAPKAQHFSAPKAPHVSSHGGGGHSGGHGGGHSGGSHHH